MNAHRVYLTITGLDGPVGRLSRADIGINVRRKLDFPTAGAWFGGLPEHGPVQWLQAAPPAAPERHESMRLFTPVDVMRGQMGFGDAS